jgi:hypothetical protein
MKKPISTKCVHLRPALVDRAKRYTKGKGIFLKGFVEELIKKATECKVQGTCKTCGTYCIQLEKVAHIVKGDQWDCQSFTPREA